MGGAEGALRIRCTAALKLGTPRPPRPHPLLEAPAASLGTSVPGRPPSQWTAGSFR